MASTWHSGIANQPVFHFLSNCTAFTFELFSARFRFLNGPSRESGSGTESLIPLKLADNNRPTDPHSLKTLHQCKWNWDKRKMFICLFSLLVFFVVDCRTAIALHIYEIRGSSLRLHFPCQWLRWGDVFCWGGSIFFSAHQGGRGDMLPRWLAAVASWMWWGCDKDWLALWCHLHLSRGLAPKYT